MFMHYAQAQCAVKHEVMVLAKETDFSKFWPKMKELASTSVKHDVFLYVIDCKCATKPKTKQCDYYNNLYSSNFHVD